MLFAQTAISFLLISQLCLTCVYFLAFHRQQVLGKLYALYCICLIAYVADNLPQLDSLPFLNHSASFFAILSPGIFWLISRFYFEDESRFPIWVIGVIAVYTSLRFVGVLAEGSELESVLLLRIIFFVLPNFIMLALALHIIYMAIAGRRIDLVEKRRQARLPLAMAMGLILLLVIATETLLLPNSQLDNAFFLALFLLAMLLNIRLFAMAKNWLELDYVTNIDTLDQTLPLPPEQEVIQRILSKMQDERSYSVMGLTIVDLAKQLDLSEHRLRQLINHQLHYRNFNQFLNHYRIAEASRRLHMQEEAHLPILTIAMDVGYRSLSVFNKAFLNTHKVTPSEYRRKAAISSK